ncbi:hypothetical protein [Dyadobacter sp. CY347]|uniref:hypothetical protein n=1 Tax=Dyadobacter sp. CY347 TaxID=2909336 RepID=UPI001F201AD9|nr:hypothetical protein [Dyadobacter sp. CY347]MCF2491177.1 hypothetical protein [Dyadobacter sp. CY347]
MLICCKKSDGPSTNGYEYLPLEVGRFTTYDVSQATYSAGKTVPVVSNWQEKDEVISSSEGSDGSLIFVVARSSRKAESEYWQKVKEYTITRSPDKVLTSIDNVSVFSLAFPVANRIEWNGNSYNNREKQTFRYEDVDKPFDLKDQRFGNTLNVVERKDSSVINKYIGQKRYAQQVGLIFEEQIALEYCQTPDCLENDKQIIESGFSLKKTINQYGNN